MDGFRPEPVPTVIANIWRATCCAPGEWTTPRDIQVDADWLDAPVPGTAAEALSRAGRFDLMNPPDLDDQDWWYVTSVKGHGRKVLHFGGLASVADVWLDDVLVAQSRSMFVEQDVETELSGSHQLAIRFHALGPILSQPGKRARWRPKLVTPQTLRNVRTTLLGRMNGWCPPVHAVGPWRDISIQDAQALRAIDIRASTSFDGRDGRLLLTVTLNACVQGATASCAGVSASACQDASGPLSFDLRVPQVAPWWPHTHGAPALHEVTLDCDGERLFLGRVGFRTISVDRGPDGDGFTVHVNGTPVFCRGALWTTPDLVSLPGTREAYEPLLMLARDAGMNMIRVGGTMVYESRAFHDLCDELGILVWQDFMFSNMDYPAKDPSFVELVEQEAHQVLKRTALSPSLAVLCGGSEVWQQSAMMGLPKEMWSNAIFDETLPQIAHERRPDVPYVPNTPFGGELPFEPGAGLCHYYGVSAYMRPVADARHAGVRFATECLGFANVPDGDVPLENDRAAITQPLWGEKFDRDVGATWFFEEVRNHYLRELYSVDPEQIRRQDPGRYLDLSRAVNAELMEQVFALWRRSGSPTSGGLVWFLRDVSYGAGYGLIDAHNEPKSVWYALRRAFRPVQVLLTDEGLGGLYVHLVNESAQPVEGELELTCLREGATPVMNARQKVSIPPRGTLVLSATSMWGAFFDATYSYRFGPPSHDLTVARLRDASGATASEAFHFPLGRSVTPQPLGLQADLVEKDGAFHLRLSTTRFAHSVHIADIAFRAADNWFHLAPGEEKIVLLQRRAMSDARPCGSVRATNGGEIIAYGGPT